MEEKNKAIANADLVILKEQIEDTVNTVKKCLLAILTFFGRKIFHTYRKILGEEFAQESFQSLLMMNIIALAAILGIMMIMGIAQVMTLFY